MSAKRIKYTIAKEWFRFLLHVFIYNVVIPDTLTDQYTAVQVYWNINVKPNIQFNHVDHFACALHLNKVGTYDIRDIKNDIIVLCFTFSSFFIRQTDYLVNISWHLYKFYNNTEMLFDKINGTVVNLCWST